MSKQKKLLEKLHQNPNNVSFDDIDNLLKRYGFTRRQPRSGSSHYTYTLKTDQKTYRLTVPCRKPLKPVYVKQALAIIDELEAESEND